jgi:ABC-type Zn uptake system ZnuABC Zn-binding protein ZnuA
MLASACFALLLAGGLAAAAPLRVVATVPNLASLAREVGGADVSVAALTSASADPRALSPTDADRAALAGADLYLRVGRGLEDAWSPALVVSAGNPHIAPGSAGDFDASGALGVSADAAAGCAGYLLDPVMALRVARAISERLAALRPGRAAMFESRFQAFQERLLRSMIGDTIVDAVGIEIVAESARTDAATDGLLTADEPDGGVSQGGWFGQMAPAHGARVAADAALWSSFAERFGLELVPVSAAERPGSASALLVQPSAPPADAMRLARAAGVPVIDVASQVGSRGGTGDYLGLITYNVGAIGAVLASPSTE